MGLLAVTVLPSFYSGNPINFTANTLTDAATSTEAETFTPSGTAVAAGTFSTAIVIHDALGASHVLTGNFTKTAANTWQYQLTVPTTDLKAGGNPVISSGTLNFNWGRAIDFASIECDRPDDLQSC